MRRRTLPLLAVLEAGLFLAAVWFEPSCGVRGILCGEAFFDGKSTSWWRHELARWELVDGGPIVVILGLHQPLAPPDPFDHLFGGQRQNVPKTTLYQRDITWRDRLLQGDREFWKDRPGQININNESFSGPAILSGGADAELVLRALIDDPSPRVRRMARIGLKLERVEDGP